MAVCPSCNATLKDGDWTCGACGAPVAGADMAPADRRGGSEFVDAYGGGSPYYQPEPAGAAASPTRDSSGLLKAALVIAAIAVLAIVLIWFFFLRGPATTGEEFLGTWTATIHKGIAAAVIVRRDDVFSVTLSGDQADQKVTVPAHLDATDLVITVDDFSQMAGAEKAEALKAALKAIAGDFKIIVSSVSADQLSLRIVGTTPSGDDFDETIPFARARTSAP
jgi:hypothetical protein